MLALALTISLKVSAIFPWRPVQSPGRRTEKSPLRTACIAPRRAESSVPGWVGGGGAGVAVFEPATSVCWCMQCSEYPRG